MDADPLSGGDRFEIKGGGSLAAGSPILKVFMAGTRALVMGELERVHGSKGNGSEQAFPYPQNLWITLWTSQVPEVKKRGHIAYLLPW